MSTTTARGSKAKSVVTELPRSTVGPVFERRVRGDGVSLAITERGRHGAPTVLLVHGYPDSQAVWEKVARKLAERYHVVTYDVRGAGRSEAPTEKNGYSLAHLSRDLRAVIEAVSPEKPVHLVGHDWGSIHSWESVTDPSFEPLLASFTSISGPCLDHVGEKLRSTFGAHAELGRALRQASKSWYVFAFHLPLLAPFAWRAGLAKAIPALLGRSEGVPPNEERETTRARDGLNGIALYRENIFQRVLSPRARKTRVPVQMIAPEGDDYVSPWLSADIDAQVPNVHRRVVRGGHWIPLSQPERVARWVDEMVSHVEKGESKPAFARLRGTGKRRKLVLVTGGASGIGRETCFTFAKQGHDIVIADRDAEGAERTRDLCERLGVRATAYTVDVSDERSMTTFAEASLASDGVPDVLVLNAGIGMAGTFFDTSVSDWKRVLGVNVWGIIFGARLFGQAMKDRGEGGHVIVTASAAAYTPGKTLSAYATSKSTALMLAECLRAELAEEGIGVSAICPGIIDTPITRNSDFLGSDSATEAAQREAAERLYRLRGVGPEVVADAIVRAVKENTAVVPVTVEAHVLRFLSRFAPDVLRKAGSMSLSKKLTKSEKV